MASKRRIRRKQCKNKKQLSQNEAFNTAVRLRKTGHGTLDAYRCHLCGWWHVGHRTKKTQRTISQRRKHTG